MRVNNLIFIGIFLLKHRKQRVVIARRQTHVDVIVPGNKPFMTKGAYTRTTVCKVSKFMGNTHLDKIF